MNIHFDGLCAPCNPGGHGACGIWLDAPGLRCRQFQYLGQNPEMTNNIAEYEALIMAADTLQMILKTSSPEYRKTLGPIRIFGDSQLVVRQVTGQYMCRKPHLRVALRRFVDLMSGIPYSIEWVRREQNTEADKASRYGLALWFRDDPHYRPLQEYAVTPIDGKHQLQHDGRYCIIARDLTCTCEQFRAHKHMGMCHHLAAVIFGGLYDMIPDVEANKGQQWFLSEK